MKVDTALMQLRTMPLVFLRNNLLVIAGGQQSGVSRYYFGYKDGTFTGANEAFRLTPDPAALDRQRAGADGKMWTSFAVHNVRMIPSTEDVDVSDIEPYVLGGAGPDLMVTGQLSGCVLAVQSLGVSLAVAHIQPGGTRQTGSMLRQTVKLMGRFHGHGRVTHVFGLGDYPARAHVVGLRAAGGWRLYAQHVGSGLGPVTASTQII
jgi:hypothetical protein